MSDPDQRDRKPDKPGDSGPPRRGGSGAGRSGTASSIGAELGDLDFEPDALLDSLLAEDDSLLAEPPPGVMPSPGVAAPSEAPAAPPQPAARAAAPPPRPAAPRRAPPPRPPPRRPLAPEDSAEPSGPEARELLQSGMPTLPNIDPEHDDTWLESDEPETVNLESLPPGSIDEFEELTPSHVPDESQLTARAASVTPPPRVRSVRPVAGPGTWSNEQPVAAQLANQGMRDKWLVRAELLEGEAQTSPDPQVRARALLVASELWAMAGDASRAREVASEAAAAAPSMPLVHRQLRWLAASEDDWSAVAAALESETRASPTPEARAHAALLSAELHRLLLHDEATAQRKLDQAARALPSDPRAHVMKLAKQLGESADPPRMRWPEAPALATLVDATHELVRLRGGTPPAGVDAGSTRAALGNARTALSAHKRAAAGEAVAQLAGVEGLERGALWLAAALLAPASETRPRSIELLQRLRTRPDPGISRALAARALEQGDPGTVRAAMQHLATSGGDSGTACPDPFTAADHVALTALTGGDATTIHDSLAELAGDEALRPLAAAYEASSVAPGRLPEIGSGDERSQSEVRLGRAMAATAAQGHDPDALRAASDAFAAAHPDHPLSRVLALELAVSAGDAARLAEGLSTWPGDNSDHEAARDRHLAAGLVYEAGGNGESAVQQYALALAADATSEAATRILASRTPAQDASGLLVSLARAGGDDAQRALLLVEGAVRRGDADTDAYHALLAEAADAQPTLPFAYRLGEQHARMQGDAERLIGWLRRRRDASTDNVERALDQVREALLIADSDLGLAASLVQEAGQVRPDDAALPALHDRLAPGARADKGEWREQLAESLEPELALPLLLEASLEYERAGDRNGAARTALAAVDRGGSEFARIAAERNASAGPGAARLSEELLARTREEQDPVVLRELYERCSRLDQARGDQSSALLWQSAILEREPGRLPALRRLEQAYIDAGRDDELGSVAATLAPLLDDNESTAHVMFAARVRSRNGEWATTRELIDIATRQDSPSLWALREQSALARATGDDAAVLKADRCLCDLSNRGIDAATLALRAAEAAARLGQLPDASALLERAVELVPEHLVALTTRAEVLETMEDFAGAAESLEALASASAVPAHQLAAWHQAALLWLDKVDNSERGLLALERAARFDVDNEDVFKRLQALYVAGNERAKLAELLERRLEQTTDPEQRIALEVTRGRALAEIGDRDAAKRALATALDANPDHAGALDAFADLCAAEGDWGNAEQAWIRLARHVPDSERQADVYWKLGELYDTELPNPERAELSYREVLKRRPDDLAASQRLVHVYGRLGDTAKAVELATDLVKRASSPDQKCELTIVLAQVYEQVAGDSKKAEATLERARKQWSQNSDVLSALAGFYQRNNEDRALHMLLDRAATDARRALGTGRFDLSFFETLGTVAELRGSADAAKVALSTIAALEGREDPLRGAGPAASDAQLDELLAPELLSLPFRALLRKSGDALDTAYPIDLRALRAAPMPAEAQTFVGHVRQLASASGINSLDVFVSPTVGPVCMPVSSNPPQLVFGKELLASDDEAARYFLLVRALKILQGHASTLSRTSPIDLWPLTAAYLSVFAPNWQAQGVDVKKMAEARQRIQSAMPRNLDPDVPVLALEVIGSIGNRASQLGTAVNEWGNRAGLLAMGNPTAALRAVALALGQKEDLPLQGADRIKWIVRHPEARDIAVFSVSEQYADARSKLGLAG